MSKLTGSYVTSLDTNLGTKKRYFMPAFSFLRVASVVASYWNASEWGCWGGTEFSVNSANDPLTTSPRKDEWCAKMAANLKVSKKKLLQKSRCVEIDVFFAEVIVVYFQIKIINL